MIIDTVIVMTEVLLIEDPIYQSHKLRALIRENADDLTRTLSCHQAKVAVRQNDFDFVVMDTTRCDEKALSMVTDLRETTDVPIIVVGAYESKTSVIALFLAGASHVFRDNAILEKTLPAAINSASRKSTDSTKARRDFGAMVVKKEGSVDLSVLDASCLSPTEKHLVDYLYKRRNTPVAKKAIVSDVLKSEWTGMGRAVDVHISNIRSKFRKAGIDSVLIQTLRGHGYCLVAQ
ncbi:winged helix-turn-helix domain-containing protein [Veronia pacifica]|uniref:OmpR/PhoB-type domain-containing protein n=1 Tax=Veronia pacifica TaxID=1080227 RepID=A0A1C3E890_9GAMM|nr:winged helix-turn-helix domain-containing protein [Veronia pacifica]ODA29452.1 hypothetical protein A8L45_22175 [Veronia pacifica]